MLTYIFIAIAAIFNAIMDTLWTHFPISIFKNLDPKWWNPNISWEYVKPFLGIVRLDAWHIAKYGMLFGITFSIMSYTNFTWWDVIILPCVWSFFFELFYSKLLKLN